MASDETLAVRALNHWRSIDDFSYLGLRLLTAPLMRYSSDWSRTITWGAANREHRPRYRPIIRFKSIDRTGKYEFRGMLASSPSTAIAEARTLDILASASTFRSHPNVYSYILAPSKRQSGRSYNYYLDHYLRRNAAIREQLTRNPSLCVVVADIRDFYPSIRSDHVRRSFLAKAEISAADPRPDKSEHNMIRATLDAYLRSSGKHGRGLAVGPALSHVAANVAMDHIDTALTRRHGSRYTRYVDDFAIVVERTSANECIRDLDRLLNSSGFRLNEDKTDIVDSSVWISGAPVGRSDELSDLSALAIRMGLFCSRSESQREALSAALYSEGIRVPLWSLQSQTRYRRWRMLFRRRVANQPGLAVQVLTDSISRLTRDALHCRSLLRRRLTDAALPSSWEETNPTARRWRTSELRRILWWSLQLLPVSELEAIGSDLTQARGLETVQATISALRTGNVTNLMVMPGAPVVQAISLLRSARVTPYVDWHRVQPSGATVESALILAARARVFCPDEWLDDFVMKDDAANLIRRLQGRAGNARQVPNGGYVDEIDSLLLGCQAGSEQALLDTRISLDELNPAPSWRLFDAS